MIVLYAICMFVVALIALRAVKHPGAAITLILGLHVIKQVLHSQFYLVGQYSLLTNFAIAIVTFSCFFRYRFDLRRPFGYASDQRIPMLRTLFFAFTFASVMWSTTVAESGESWKYGVIYVGLFAFLLPALMGREEDIRELLRTGLWLGAALCVAAFFTANWTGRHIEYAGGQMVFNRVTGNFQEATGSALEMADLCVRTVLIAVLLDRRSMGKVLTLLRWPIVLVAVATLLKSGSRGQVIVMAATILVMFPFTRNLKDIKSVLRSTIILAGVLGVFYWIFSFIQTSARWDTELLSKDMDLRTSIATKSLTAWLSDGPFAFLFGHGFDASFDPRFDIPFPEVGPAAVILDLGLLGIVVWISIIYLGARSWWRTYQLVRGDEGMRCMTVALAAMALSTFILSFKGSGYYMVLAWCVVFTRMEAAIHERLWEQEPQDQPILDPAPTGGPALAPTA